MTKKTLPIGVLVPTRNSMPYLGRHLSALQKWIDLAEEVVVVDSVSCDGTLEVLRSELRHPKLKVLSHPPGLYQSWNFGVQHVSAPYTYIATVGDVITLEGLTHLLEVADRFRSDVVLSPPSFETVEGEVLARKRWTIHHYMAMQNVSGPMLLPRSHLFLTSVIAGMTGMMGSSASNLYRTAVLKQHPFPTEFAHVGDAAWGLGNAFAVQTALTPRACASFLIHPNEGQVSETAERETEAKMLKLAHLTLERGIREGQIPEQASAFWAVIQEYEALRGRVVAADSSYYEYRRAKVPWFLCPGAWRARRDRNESRVGLQTLWKRSLTEFSF